MRDGKIRVRAQSWDDARTVLAGQVLAAHNVNGQVMIDRRERQVGQRHIGSDRVAAAVTGCNAAAPLRRIGGKPASAEARRMFLGIAPTKCAVGVAGGGPGAIFIM